MQSICESSQNVIDGHLDRSQATFGGSHLKMNKDMLEVSCSDQDGDNVVEEKEKQRLCEKCDCERDSEQSKASKRI